MNEQSPEDAWASFAAQGHTITTYDWPADGLDPFTLDAQDRPLWFLIAGRGWGKAWPAGDLRDFEPGTASETGGREGR